jgi:hypothetical protein
MNNNTKNNHIYTICVSDIRMGFFVDKFIGIGKNEVEKI